MNTEEIKKYLSEKFGNNLCAIVLEGTFKTDKWVEGWSDNDFLIILRDTDYKFQIELSSISRHIEQKINSPVSLDMTSLNNICSKDMFFLVPPKTVQAVYESKFFPDKIIYKNTDEDFWHPNDKEIREFSFDRFLFFYYELQKIIQRNFDSSNPDKLKDLCRRVIKHTFNLTKFLVQYKTLIPSQSKNETITLVKDIYSDFNFEKLYFLESAVKSWKDVNEKEVLELIHLSFEFSEKFVSRVSREIK